MWPSSDLIFCGPSLGSTLESCSLYRFGQNDNEKVRDNSRGCGDTLPPRPQKAQAMTFCIFIAGGLFWKATVHHDTQIHYGYGLIWAGRAARITSHLQSLLQDVQISEKVPGVETERDLCII